VRSLANEWAKHGINVNAIAPGYMNTEMLRGLSDDPVRWPQISSRIPAGRLGEPDELVGTAIYLASAASSYVYGHALVVDGGWLSR
jgi:2-deoxy-D-gluconate 3-dehydrogenase